MNSNREELLFGLALLKPALERAAFLDRECADDAALRQRLEALLAAHDQPDPLLRSQDADAKPTNRLNLPVEPKDEAVGQNIGRYKLLERVGEGGCGVVYVAEQTEPVRRRVALKVIKLGMDTKAVVARFEAERQALAMMDHPNIAKVFDAGTTETGRPYFIMELVRGIRITEYCDQNNLSTTDRLDLFLKVCQAIQHAHQKGIIHRDIKPSNILVTLHDGEPVPKVIDFGIAKATEGRLTEATVYTQLHQFIGTPAYMSPEQAEMSGLDIDTRSDIYSLGVLLYELLTGRTPFDANELMSQGIDVMRKIIREQEPVRPSTRFATLKGDELTTTARRRSAEAPKLIHLLRGDLDWIVMKCLEKDRTRRYETANGLATDLKRHLTNEPVVARPPSQIYRLQKAWRRNKLAYSAVLAVAAALVVGITISAWEARFAIRAQRETEDLRVAEKQQRLAAEQERDQANSARAETERQRLAAEKSRQEAQARAYASDINLAQHALDDGKLGTTLALLNQPDPGSQRGWEWRYLWQQSRSEASSLFCRVERGVVQLAASHDGRFLAVKEYFSTLRLWDLSARKQVTAFSASQNCRPVFSARRGLFAYSGPMTSATNDTGVHIWDPATGRDVVELPTGWCRGFEFSADEETVVSCDGEGNIVRWQLPEGRKLSTYSCDRPPRYDNSGVPFAISPEARLAAVGGFSGQVIMVNLETGEQLWRSEGTDGRGYSLAFSPDGKMLAVGTALRSGIILLLESATGHEQQRLSGHRSAVSSLAFWPDGLRLASASHDQTIGLWDLHDLARIPRPRLLRGHKLEVWTLALMPDGRTLASGSKDGEVCLWDTRSKPREPFARVEAPADAVWYLSGEDQTVRGIHLAARELLEWHGPGTSLQHTPMLLETGARQACWSHDGRCLAVGATNGSVQIWEIPTLQLIAQFSAGTNSVTPLQFDRDNRQLAVVSVAGAHQTRETFALWTFPPVRKAFSTPIPEGYSAIHYSGYVFFSVNASPALGTTSLPIAELGPDGWMAKSLALWTPSNGMLLKIEADAGATLNRENLDLTSIAISPEGGLLAWSSFSGITRVHDTRTGRQLARLQGFFNAASGLGFSPDGRRLAVGSGGDGDIKIYHTTTWRELISLSTDSDWVANLRFSSDGNSLRAHIQGVSQVEEVRSWHVPLWEEIATVEAKEKAEVRLNE